jgi:hypothetical protein
MPKDQLGSELWRRIGNGCGPGGPRDPSRMRRAGRQAGSAGDRGAQGQPAGWQCERSGSGRAAAQAVRGGGRPAGRRPSRKAATRCSGGRNMLQQIRDPNGERAGDAVVPARAGRPEEAKHLRLGACGGRQVARTGGVRVQERRGGRAENFEQSSRNQRRHLRRCMENSRDGNVYRF